MELDAEGRLVVTRVWTDEVLVLDPDSGAVVETFSEGVSGPDDVAMGPDGSLYVADPFGGEVLRLQDGAAPALVGRVQGANAITFDAQGRLWVGGCFTGEDLYELAPDGASAPRLAAEALGRDCAMNGMVPGGDGRLYGAQPTLQRLVAWDPETGALEVVADETGPGAYAVAFLETGELIALRRGEIARVDLNQADLTQRLGEQWASLPVAGDNLLVRGDGEVFVSDSTTGEVVALREGGEGRTVFPGAEGSSFPEAR